MILSFIDVVQETVEIFRIQGLCGQVRRVVPWHAKRTANAVMELGGDFPLNRPVIVMSSRGAGCTLRGRKCGPVHFGVSSTWVRVR